MLVLVAHGNLKECLFAGLKPDRLAKILCPLLPDKYSGEIYLAGCHTGERRTDKQNKANLIASYIENFYKAIKAYRTDVCPMIKGNKNVSIASDYGEYVQEGGNEQFMGDPNGEDVLDSAATTKFYKGKKGKLHIDKEGRVVEPR